MSADAESRLKTIRHEWSYVRRYLENTGGPTLKIHLARLEDALATPEPSADEPSTSDGTELYRPSRVCMSDYVVTDHPTDAADLLDRVAFAVGPAIATPEITRWRQDFTDFRDAR